MQTAAGRAAWQQHGAAAELAEPKANDDDFWRPGDDWLAGGDTSDEGDESEGAAEAMEEDDAAPAFADVAVLPPPAKVASPPRGRGARGLKSARASRPDPNAVRNSDEKPTRRVPPPRAATTNHTAIVFRAGGNRAATTAQRRQAPGGLS